MNARDRFREALLFGTVDRVPLDPGYPRESTRAAWATQGLPEGADHRKALCEELGIDDDPGVRGMGEAVSFKMIPEFEEKVLEHRDGHYVVQDWMGAITEISDEYDYTYIRSARDFVTRKWHKFPVETHADWQEMKRRFDPEEPGRCGEAFDALCAQQAGRDCPLSLAVTGPFWQLREWCGMENLCIMMAEDPGFVREMVDFWTEFVSRVFARAFEGVVPDHVCINEDMAYKVHSMISPSMTREFLLPTWVRWTGELKAAGCPVVDIDSDGYIAELIPIWLEAGVNCTSPLEVAAGNDIVDYRKLYGRKLAFRGGIDKRAIAKGGAVMEEEVRRVVRPLLKEGGFIPGCDHGAPPDISWPAYVDYSRLLARLTGWL